MSQRVDEHSRLRGGDRFQPAIMRWREWIDELPRLRRAPDLNKNAAVLGPISADEIERLVGASSPALALEMEEPRIRLAGLGDFKLIGLRGAGGSSEGNQQAKGNKPE